MAARRRLERRRRAPVPPKAAELCRRVRGWRRRPAAAAATRHDREVAGAVLSFGPGSRGGHRGLCPARVPGAPTGECPPAPPAGCHWAAAPQPSVVTDVNEPAGVLGSLASKPSKQSANSPWVSVFVDTDVLGAHARQSSAHLRWHRVGVCNAGTGGTQASWRSGCPAHGGVLPATRHGFFLCDVSVPRRLWRDRRGAQGKGRHHGHAAARARQLRPLCPGYDDYPRPGQDYRAHGRLQQGRRPRGRVRGDDQGTGGDGDERQDYAAE